MEMFGMELCDGNIPLCADLFSANAMRCEYGDFEGCADVVCSLLVARGGILVGSGLSRTLLFRRKTMRTMMFG